MNDKVDINLECGLLLSFDNPASLEINIPISTSKRIGKQKLLQEIVNCLKILSASAGSRHIRLDKIFLSIFLNWECGLLLPVDYLISLVNYIFICV